MKTILVDAVNTFVIKDKGVFIEMYQLLEKYPNRKIVVTNANDEQIGIFSLNKLPYELFILKYNPEKTSSEYFKILLHNYNLERDDVVYFEHNAEAVRSAELLGIKAYHYKAGDLDGLKKFLDENIN